MPVHGGIPIHAPQHEDGGIDEIDVTGLAGLLADDQHVLDAEVLAVAAALVHAGRHEDGGADEVNVGGLSGVLADDQHVIDAEVLAVAAALVHAARHQNAGADEISVLGLSGLLADAQTPLAHATTHEPGGADEVSGIDLPNAPAADETGWGLETTDTVGEIVEAGEILYMKADGKYWLADADGVATMPALVMAMEDLAADASGRLLHIGYMRQDAWDWTLANGEANLLWASVTPGAMSPDQPVGAGDQVQVVAYIVSADRVFFNPSYELVEVA